ncbi:hypothetical protein A2865_03545 [Candidatus Woesebacteria bacterium RIFCSPHIGHO2_01_FULL_39_17]|uniref:DNA-(Apurinic or apyrimidinic site) lyase n=3 Tax=Candidatus Woeseibacteriota TaxID=1752722 RepID=A0A0G0RL04_9BACT|nr:MAG: putative endonuclease III (DNA-(apurinic orapyrimidinic site) lyase), endonuclease III [Microgenomates group bacterium GW2011_GWC1_38_12]KKQ93774.1 MAG: DNA-(Apurinic or apyrimidinic site) lyase [Candidatus Woesebacteria bacterium GW2011_GWB1_39_10b]KKR14337.1 MAG: DNA-(Apurinic or apyrimidinic site) lyase [Candidatus Woesebacteria bacterium GW2011_GWA1_39_21b]OGM23606.1 MAG: hypothetical protein A2865_03545 [Candidatus Woesebacteria bacterium RIFCSPHIGHO2_01_FULL_39_17]OGM64342.1 MAG: 
MAKNFKRVFSLFKKRYKIVPLETFADDPYKTLVSTVLSSRTKDETTHLAAKRLFKRAPDMKKLGQLEQLEIRNLIYPVGFYKTKAKHLKMLAERILEPARNATQSLAGGEFSSKGRSATERGGKIPETREELTKLPGVGRKTANLVLNRAFDIPAIAVDTHVHKISNLLGWVKTKTPQQTEKELVKIIPKKYWSDMNRLFVSIGRQFNSKRKLEEFLRKNGLIA